MPLRELAPGKINLCLYVGRPRADGYHPLVSVVQSLSLADMLELSPDPDASGDVVLCPGVPGDNLAGAALALVRKELGWDGPPQRLVIDKRVPIAAGMGGGSADAAAALRLAARAAGLPMAAVAPLAPRLGADVPSQLSPGRVLMTGIGEHISPLPDAAEDRGFLVLPSVEGLSTPAVYREFDCLGLGRESLDGLDLDALHNDLEPAALSLMPSIARALDAARDAGAEHAMVSGSGPTVVGVFRSVVAARGAAQAIDWPGAVAAEAVRTSATGA